VSPSSDPHPGASEPLPFADICAVLVREPFHLSIAQIAELTDEQLLDIYLRADPRDDSTPTVNKRGEKLSDFEVFSRVWKRRGWSDEAISKRWAEKNAKPTPKPKPKRKR
jgi:hypothetical protein